ncbi:tRNA (adenosine(37)-N6)-threonylcarbamoyltransferase complex transferase subunit TsaD [Candidatus Peregrinibacteria bacterium]|nr:tRNA (adenosine(37)-N6)-threonylcarbamoyltransferase complex transferase subunit TsaD [Candidatus Peregrinibacteria bacterium]MBT3598435.1 tRNA (adenosine(37)-N6)-threonylcarbamoyltransferase complex transferase subunit TsaD [Candidatus Peregrinibacteria bacterium]MBT4367732.1 tRNA (adenosine(37)-N6)-threonylcarbamoyltransferase complex transferase subunit TsaD [Candidatus Peregrinibacteria bacterium]MBT4585350.1 tRNA (adenosine(37)-N6)-threonylcarbamoyltransferase complex transferase subunit
MLILGIETSCDETSVAIVEDGRKVLSNVTSSSIELFENAGGVIPEEAARAQVEYMIPVLNTALSEANLSAMDIDAVAVTKGPGLLGSLLVGTSTARAFCSIWNKPLIGVNHTLGHLSSVWLECEDEPSYPILTLSVSGGHTDLWLRKSHTEGILLGSTKDDAAGEAFDKGAIQLGLPYPGGPSISKTAIDGDATSHKFPLPLANDKSLDFSFSGLKTSLKYLLRDLNIDTPESLTDKQLVDISASYENAICAHLVDRLKRAVSEHDECNEIHIVGGVSANNHLREIVNSTFKDKTVRCPTKIKYCTDNGSMIAAAGYFLFREKGDLAYESFKSGKASD